MLTSVELDRIDGVAALLMNSTDDEESHRSGEPGHFLAGEYQLINKFRFFVDKSLKRRNASKTRKTVRRLHGACYTGAAGLAALLTVVLATVIAALASRRLRARCSDIRSVRHRVPPGATQGFCCGSTWFNFFFLG